MRAIVTCTIAFGLAALAGAQASGANGVVVQPYVFADFPDSGFNYTANYPNVMFNDPNVNASGQGSGSGSFANRHLWWTSNDSGATTYGLTGPDDYFDFTLTLNLTASGGSRKEAGMFIRTGSPSNLEGQFMVSSNFGTGSANGEVAVFGGPFPFHSFTAAHGVNYTEGTNATLGLRYFKDSDGIYKFVYRYNDITMPAMPLGNGFDTSGLPTGTMIGGYFQVPKNASDPNAANGATVNFTNISVAPVPEPASMLVLGGGLLALARKRRSRARE